MSALTRILRGMLLVLPLAAMAMPVPPDAVCVLRAGESQPVDKTAGDASRGKTDATRKPCVDCRANGAPPPPPPPAPSRMPPLVQAPRPPHSQPFFDARGTSGAPSLI